MIIGVDAGCLGVTDERLKVGVYQVALNLLVQLSRLDKENFYRLYSFYPISSHILAQLNPFMKNIVLKPAKGWVSIRLPLEFLIRKPDVFLGLSQAVPWFHPSKTIIIVHDLAFEFYPECFPDSFPKLSLQTRQAVQRADKIIAISSSTKKDLINCYKTPQAKIEVVYEGYDPIFRPLSQEEIKKIKEKYRLLKPYFLFVGALKRIKNIPLILRGFSKFLEKSKKDFNLLIAGGNVWLDPEISPTIRKLSLRDKVIFPGYLPFSDLPGFYNGALAFISPSLYEGCGITLLEAMACGTPVITSNVSAMPEIVGKAGILVDPKNAKEICEAMERVALDEKLRKELITKGLEQVKKFSWAYFAQGVLGQI